MLEAKRKHHRAWTPEMDDRLRKIYNYRPMASIVASINEVSAVPRTRRSILMRAAKLGIGDRIPKGYVTLIEAHPRMCGDHYGASVAIVRAAKRDGVLKQMHYRRGRPYIAPEEWVEQYVQQRLEVKVDEDLAYVKATWWRTRRFAAELGISPQHACARLLHTRGWLSNRAKGARWVKLHGEAGQPIYWHPDDAQAILRDWRHRRAFKQAA